MDWNCDVLSYVDGVRSLLIKPCNTFDEKILERFRTSAIYPKS